MEKLGKDCFARICRSLPVRDQINLAKAYPKCRKLILKRVWLPQFRRVDSGTLSMMYFEHSPDIFSLLVPYITHLTIAEMANFDFYFSFIYPRVHTFNQVGAHGKANLACTLAAMCCPRIECLSMDTTHRSGAGITNMYNLHSLQSNNTPIKSVHLMSILDGHIKAITHLDLCGYVDKTPMETLFSEVVKDTLTNLCVPYSVISFGFVELIAEMELTDLRIELKVNKLRESRAPVQQMPPWAFFHSSLGSRIYEMRVIKTKNKKIYDILQLALPFLSDLTKFHFKYNRSEYTLQELSQSIFYPAVFEMSLTDTYVCEDSCKEEEAKDGEEASPIFRDFGPPEFDLNGLTKLICTCNELQELNLRFSYPRHIQLQILGWFSEIIPLVRSQNKSKPLIIRFQCLKNKERTTNVIKSIVQSDVYKKQDCCVIEACNREFREDDINTDMIEYRFKNTRKTFIEGRCDTSDDEVEEVIHSDFCSDHSDSDDEVIYSCLNVNEVSVDDSDYYEICENDPPCDSQENQCATV